MTDPFGPTECAWCRRCLVDTPVRDGQVVGRLWFCSDECVQHYAWDQQDTRDVMIGAAMIATALLILIVLIRTGLLS